MSTTIKTLWPSRTLTFSHNRWMHNHSAETLCPNKKKKMRMDNNNYSNKVKRTCLLHHSKNYALTHRDRTRVQMLAKIFPHLKVKCLLFMGPTFGFDTKPKNSFFDQIWCFLQLKLDSDNIIHC